MFKCDKNCYLPESPVFRKFNKQKENNIVENPAFPECKIDFSNDKFSYVETRKEIVGEWQ